MTQVKISSEFIQIDPAVSRTAVIDGVKIATDGPTPFYVTGTFAKHVPGSSVHARGEKSVYPIWLKYDDEHPTGGYFNVAGRPTKPLISVSSNQIAKVDDDNKLQLLEPGEVEVIVRLGESELRLPIEIVELPVPPRCTEDQAIEILGFPDDKKEGRVNWPNSDSLDGEFYSSTDSNFGPTSGYWSHWRYKKYPGAVVVFGSNGFKVITRH